MDRYIRDHGGTETDYIAHQNAKLLDLSAGWVRSAGRGDRTSLHWSTVEPQAGQFDFALHDERVRDEASRGLNELGSVDFSYPPDYALRPGMYFDDDMYLGYLNAIVERYDGDSVGDMPGLRYGVKYWEIGNEVTNADSFGGTAEDYAHVLQISYESIKANCPDCQVLVGGWAIGHGDEVKWQKVLAYIDTVLANGGGQAFDIMNFHEYTDDCDFKTYEHVAGLTALLAKYNLAKPVWITEGNTKLFDDARQPLHTIERQAQDLIKRIVVAYDAGVDVYFWHGLDDLPGSPGVGFYDEAERPKPIYYNLKLLVDHIAGYSSLQRLDFGPNAFVYLFDVGGYSRIVAWTEGDPTAVDLSPYFDDLVDVRVTRAITVSGQSTPDATVGSPYLVHLDKTPVLVEQTTPHEGYPTATDTPMWRATPTAKPTFAPRLHLYLPTALRT
jgi:hypothetical protein